MGASVSKSKSFQFKPLASIRPDSNHKMTDYKMNHQGSSMVASSSANGPKNKSINKKKIKKYRRNHQVGSVSVKNKKPKYKKVTKSIIGKPTNFKHTRHMGVDDIISGQTDVSFINFIL